MSNPKGETTSSKRGIRLAPAQGGRHPEGSTHMVGTIGGRLIGKVTLAGAGLLVTALATAACGGGQHTASGGAPTTGAPTTTANSMAATTLTATSHPDTAAGSGGGAATTPDGSGLRSGSGRAGECTAANLRLSLGQGDAAMSHVYLPLQFTNTGRTSCTLVGFPGVSYVTGDEGRQVGAPAVRDGTIGSPVTLAPGQLAAAIVTEVQVGVFDASACQPTPVRGLRVYPPDDTAAMFIAQASTGCAGNPPEPQLHVQTIKAGSGNQG
jgi:uncharacterized protein DUF4232